MKRTGTDAEPAGASNIKTGDAAEIGALASKSPFPPHPAPQHPDLIKYSLVPNPAATTKRAWFTMAAPDPAFYRSGLELGACQLKVKI